MSSSADTWAEFDTLRHGVKQNTVDRLKQIITGFNEECSTALAKSGKKQDLIDRIHISLDNWRATGAVDKWQKARAIIYQVRTSGQYAPRPSASTYHATSSHSPYPLPSPTKIDGHSHTFASSSRAPARTFEPYATARTAPVLAAPSVKQSINFKPSPFLRVEQHVSTVVECPESSGSMDRRQASLRFTLTDDQIAKLNSASPKYQLRLYCTSATYYTPSSYRASQELCLVEFPPTCEIRVNGTVLNANVKGLKKKPGTAPPADLGKTVKTSAQNSVEMVYVNSAQNTAGKKYYIVVMLVEVTTVDQLVERLKKGKYRDRDSIVQKMRIQAADDDDDIIAGPQKMSLRDSLTFIRVSVPSRSEKCVHPQCFDASTWYSMMEQTTTWLCPVCDKVLDPNDLIVDGYFEDILKRTDEDVEDVMVEADGEWHTSDNKYASAGWRATHPIKEPSPPVKCRSPSPAKAIAPPEEIFVLDDSDEEDEGRVKRELSPRYGRAGTFSAQSSYGTLPPGSQVNEPASGIIDLTLSSDDEEPAPTPVRRLSPTPLIIPPRAEKRKTADEQSPSEAVWKKSRSDGYTNGSSSVRGSSASPHVPTTATPHGGSRIPSSSYQSPEDDRYSYRSPPGDRYYSGHTNGSRNASSTYRAPYAYTSTGRNDSSSGTRWS